MSICHVCGKDLGMGGGNGYVDEINGIGSWDKCVTVCDSCLYSHVRKHYPGSPVEKDMMIKLGIGPGKPTQGQLL